MSSHKRDKMGSLPANEWSVQTMLAADGIIDNNNRSLLFLTHQIHQKRTQTEERKVKEKSRTLYRFPGKMFSQRQTEKPLRRFFARQLVTSCMGILRDMFACLQTRWKTMARGQIVLIFFKKKPGRMQPTHKRPLYIVRIRAGVESLKQKEKENKKKGEDAGVWLCYPFRASL